MNDNLIDSELNAIRDARRTLVPFDAATRFRILAWLSAWASDEASDAEDALNEAGFEGRQH